MNAPSGPPYQVATIDTGCCSNTIEHSRIAAMANQMAASGYKLQSVLIDVRSQCGPCCPTRCAVMIFKRMDIP